MLWNSKFWLRVLKPKSSFIRQFQSKSRIPQVISLCRLSSSVRYKYITVNKNTWYTMTKQWEKVALFFFFLYGLVMYMCRRYLIYWIWMKNYRPIMKHLCPESIIWMLIQLWVHSNYLYLSASCTGVMKLLPSLVLVDWFDSTAFSTVGMPKEDHLLCFSMVLVWVML